MLAENILRVDAERIDSVLNLVGELIIGKSMLQQMLNEFARHFPKTRCAARFADAMAFQSRVLNDLQRSVMKIRMVPVEQLFRRFPRMVRDVASHCGKDVELVVNGAGHRSGQESSGCHCRTSHASGAQCHQPRHREPPRSASAPASARRARSRLIAYHQGNQVIMEVTDDGRGIDVAKVKAKAIEQGLLPAEEAHVLSEAETLELVFRPGLQHRGRNH